MLGIQSEEAAYHLQKSQLVTNLPVFVFHKMLKEGTKPADCPLMVLTKYIDNSNHWKTVNGKKVERFMETNEFVAGVSYTCMIVITNVSPIQQVVEVMDPIPRGSYPLSTLKSLVNEVKTGSYPLSTLKSLVNEVKTIDAFSTCTMSYSFVLPISRRWETLNIFQHTSSIQRRRPSSLLLLLPSFTTLHCVKEAKTLDVTSWKDVALNASEDVLLDSIRSHDVQELEWKEVCAEQTVQCFVLYEAGC